jgi:hypothetical protein
MMEYYRKITTGDMMLNSMGMLTGTDTGLRTILDTLLYSIYLCTFFWGVCGGNCAVGRSPGLVYAPSLPLFRVFSMFDSSMMSAGSTLALYSPFFSTSLANNPTPQKPPTPPTTTHHSLINNTSNKHTHRALHPRHFSNYPPFIVKSTQSCTLRC